MQLQNHAVIKMTVYSQLLIFFFCFPYSDYRLQFSELWGILAQGLYLVQRLNFKTLVTWILKKNKLKIPNQWFYISTVKSYFLPKSWISNYTKLASQLDWSWGNLHLSRALSHEAWFTCKFDLLRDPKFSNRFTFTVETHATQWGQFISLSVSYQFIIPVSNASQSPPLWTSS